MEMDFRNRAQLIGTVRSEVNFEEGNGSRRGCFEMSTLPKKNENSEDREIHKVIAAEHLALTLRMVGQGDLIAIEGRLTYDKESRALIRAESLILLAAGNCGGTRVVPKRANGPEFKKLLRLERR